MAEVKGCPRAPSPRIVVSRSPCATFGGESPDPQLDIGATFVGDAPEPQLRIDATNAAMTEAARKRVVPMTDAAGMKRRAGAECRKQTLIWQPGLAKRSCLSSLQPGGEWRAQVQVWREVEVAALVVPVLHVIARCLPSRGTRSPLERRRIAEQCDVNCPRHVRTVDNEVDRCDDRLSAGEERPPVYKDARAIGGDERVGEPGGIHDVCDH